MADTLQQLNAEVGELQEEVDKQKHTLAFN